MRLRLLPVLIFVIILALGSRVYELQSQLGGVVFTFSQALAQSDAELPGRLQPLSAEQADEEESLTRPPEQALNAASTLEDSESLSQLAAVLRTRQQALDERENRIRIREGVLKVAEDRLKEREQTIEARYRDIAELIGRIEDNNDAETTRLVSIYSNMKPRNAAQIFDTLDVGTVARLMRRMNPRRTAPIIAEMMPEKARQVTEILSRRQDLPS